MPLKISPGKPPPRAAVPSTGTQRPASHVLKNRWRYHEIDWNGPNVPITRADCNWIDPDYLDNPEEYPFVQFQVSMALGRVVGFWDENDVFNVVLLDPMHNIQPSSYSYYKVRPTKPLGSEYVELLNQFDSLREQVVCEKVVCEARQLFAEAAQPNPHAEAVLIGASAEDLQTIRDLLGSTPGLNLNAILLAGIASVQDASPTSVSGSQAAASLPPPTASTPADPA